MVGWKAILCAACLTVSGPAMAQAAVQVRVIGTYPAGRIITLGRNQNFYVHLDYDSDRPVHIWARPYFEGEAASAGSNPSRLYPAGHGEALGWFFLTGPDVRVDEIRIRAGDGTTAGTQVVAVYPVAVWASDEAAPAARPPRWVRALTAVDKAAQRAAYEKRMSEPVSAADGIFFGGFMLTMCVLGVIGLAAPAWALRRWRGGWRWAAAVPLAWMALVVLRIVVDTLRDPTSHNLWPFEIVLWGSLSCAWMAVLAIARKLCGRRAGVQ